MYFILILFGVLACLQVGQVKCFYQGENSWEDEQRAIEPEKELTSPKRWVRSLYNWIHSPLMNSLGTEEIFDGKFQNEDFLYNPPITTSFPHYGRRCTEKKKDSFFLWQDDKGEALKFGLRQIEDIENNAIRVARTIPIDDKKKSGWQYPLIYEDSDDIETEFRNIHLQPYEEEVNLREIFREKINSIMNIFSPKKKQKEKLMGDTSNNFGNLLENDFALKDEEYSEVNILYDINNNNNTFPLYNNNTFSSSLQNITVGQAIPGGAGSNLSPSNSTSREINGLTNIGNFTLK